MNRQPQAAAREVIVANAISEVVTELRMVDVADYIAFIRMESFSAVADLVDAASELYFMPGTVSLGHGGDLMVSWNEPPRVKLDMELRPRGATVYFSLTLGDELAEVEVTYVAFEDQNADPSDNTALLEVTLDEARLRPRPLISAAA